MTVPEAATQVTDTALLTAAFRMQESARADALFTDPLAGRLAGEEGAAMLRAVAHLGEVGPWSTVVRTTLIDGFVRRAIDDGVTCVLDLVWDVSRLRSLAEEGEARGRPFPVPEAMRAAMAAAEGSAARGGRTLAGYAWLVPRPADAV